jgi:N-acetylglucosaminyldiphosphoundecaprenol N-acetyl-beta-D-mannosaminyltransferase
MDLGQQGTDNATAGAGAPRVALPAHRLLGVAVTDASTAEAVALMTTWVEARRPTRAVFIVNAHTLNLACEDPDYRRVLNSADVVFGDGTGVRLAARRCGVMLKDNLVGTDLVPALMRAHVAAGYRYFLFGGTPATVTRAAAQVQLAIPGVCIAGHHDGYPTDVAEVVAMIHRARTDVLLVAMGNPLQERWIAAHRHALDVPLCIGVGGLFDHWAGNLRRAPRWVRQLGAEWVQILAQQPHKWRRYVLGNPRFLWRVLRDPGAPTSPQ